MSDNTFDDKVLEMGLDTRNSPTPGNPIRITREYLDSLLLEIRTIDAVEASTKMELFGEFFATPVMPAALSRLDKLWSNGMVEMAQGAAAAQAVMWAGIGDEEELAAIIETGAKTIKIIKPYLDEDLIYAKIAQAEKYGAFAIGMDTDFFFGNKRKRGYAITYPVGPKTQEDLKSYIKATKLPFIIKGVLSEQDAQKALDVGAAGIVVSHHGGSVLNYAVPPLMILPRIAKVIDGKIPIFVDGSISSGYDIFKALALGAKGVSVGRTIMAGLAAEGSEGVRKVIETMTEELKWTLSMTGNADCSGIDPSIIHRDR